jgi:hypothetical protein
VHTRYNLLEQTDLYTDFGLSDPTPDATSGWNYSLWDSAVWADNFLATQPVSGANPARYVRSATLSAQRSALPVAVDFAIGLRGQARARTVLVGVEVFFTQGGFL